MDSKKDILLEKKQFFLDTVARFCDKCGTQYAINDVNIIQNTGVSSIIHFSCHNCKSKHIATLIVPLGISNRVAVNTDLDVKEIKSFTSEKEISTQDILEIYTCLKNNPKVVV
ncbi:MAG: hypothetical protein UR96_C0009G0007 [candidate division WS6 bacterium GW2011_GWC1_36_11]|uniref:Uncharacterized protein n=3 Tax=Candidatus Dojkabacteria TaxID=74243 RepID=A0A0G0DEC4_9BACT|nr:MAG: hypothetical protein UR96_C0009G0007 [candidate division WS6 bacterium GW2011_GWC1_36_11]KKQ04174.1 MAG: hypothetical protein US14_C0021G0005 [candidate division WS6 bacterium GW2011_WS6_36_26]KKQ11177.1 MAG: hypothetical protein US23_C0006G0004 [candidate division WS6 bacterium GW2011_GWE1_36_69]KKQ11219.1 MAG: hypothetical protein US24_C0036G0006 [candidate division WS6 bacterium GW2011_GWC2_36_7]KKQ16548.1 MAG: hypothetical protein US29_C0022G0008 [candidate division WS6 bacterium GW